ncbi:sulfur carrier protein ThiS [Vibrio hippocampi]|uniref:Sulfur carrier protein ThiS n=1 Tax=Vibrio hippocampi TaxID=654686 RepID=A0ABM8ZFR1_9VIBR|nr:sulfur carrier protein ThiS [Vibrio hippocampi]CAH0524233.1 Sulfur carrier protein ThiS [Vibrio hippocampi]
MLEIILNQKVLSVESGTTLERLFDSLSVETKGCAVAIDNQIVPRTHWHEFELYNHVDINLFQAIAGG